MGLVDLTRLPWGTFDLASQRPEHGSGRLNSESRRTRGILRGEIRREYIPGRSSPVFPNPGPGVRFTPGAPISSGTALTPFSPERSSTATGRPATGRPTAGSSA